MHAPSLRHLLDVRPGEGRLLAVMGGFLLLNTANTTVISAAKNALFLSVYEPDLIPFAVIAAAILTALAAVILTGAVAGSKRRPLAVGLTALLGASLVVCWTLFHLHHRTAFVVYLWLSAVQVLVLTHAWGYAGSLLTGRQAKRLLPLIGMGASIGAILAGVGVGPAAQALRTQNLLWIALALLLASLPLLWLVGQPAKEPEEAGSGGNPLFVFVERAGRGFRDILGRDLLRLMAGGLVALTVTGTLIDLQLKFVLQESYGRDEITAVYGYLSAAVGSGTLVLQLWASRVLFPRFGVSFAALLQGGLLTAAAGGITAFGGLFVLAVAQALDDILQFSLQKPVEQVSLLPFPSRVKGVVLATMGGVLRPLSKATGGGIALALAGVPRALPIATLVSASAAVAAYTRHRSLYLDALERALARRAVDFSGSSTPLVVDKSTLSVIDRGLRDADPAIGVFSTSLLEQLPADEAIPRLQDLLAHGVPEVRAEAARVIGRIDVPDAFSVGVVLEKRLAQEGEPAVLARLLESLGRVHGVEPEALIPFLKHRDEHVGQAAIIALGRLGWQGTDEWLRSSLEDPDPARRRVACRAIGALGRQDWMEDVAGLLESPGVRPAALDGLTELGPIAVPVLTALLRRESLELGLRRGVVSALTTIDSEPARDALLDLVVDPALGHAALQGLARLRAAGSLEPVDDRDLGDALEAEVRRGVLLSAIATILRSEAEGPRGSFVASELDALHQEAVRRLLGLLALAYDPGRISTVTDGILSDNPARRGNALELLDGTVSGPCARGVMPFLDLVADGMPLDGVFERLPTAHEVRTRPAEALLTIDDWWARALALHHLGRDDEVSLPGPPPSDHPGDTSMMPLIERVMILKGSEFFRRFPGADLAGIAALTEVVHVTKGDVLFEQGDRGDAFYVIVDGGIDISRADTTLATLGPREGFGEMSILDGEPRSATATAVEDSTLLVLDRDSFDAIIERNPAVARGVYRVLTERLRNTLARVASG